MKPHEETWEADEQGVRIVGQAEWFLGPVDGNDVCAERAPCLSRAKLAAQAPAMARVMLRLASIGCLGRAHGCECINCRSHVILHDAGVIP